MNTKQKPNRMERISDAEMIMDGLSEPIVHVPHFQAREDTSETGRLLFFDTFFEHDRLGNCYGNFDRSEVEKIVVGLTKWLGKSDPTEALIRHAEWIYDYVYGGVDIENDEGGEYISVGCCFDELFEDLTKVLTPIIVKASNDSMDLYVMENGEWILPESARQKSDDMRRKERADCVTKIVEWLKR